MKKKERMQQSGKRAWGMYPTSAATSTYMRVGHARQRSDFTQAMKRVTRPSAFAGDAPVASEATEATVVVGSLTPTTSSSTTLQTGYGSNTIATQNYSGSTCSACSVTIDPQSWMNGSYFIYIVPYQNSDGTTGSMSGLTLYANVENSVGNTGIIATPSAAFSYVCLAVQTACSTDASLELPPSGFVVVMAGPYSNKSSNSNLNTATYNPFTCVQSSFLNLEDIAASNDAVIAPMNIEASLIGTAVVTTSTSGSTATFSALAVSYSSTSLCVQIFECKTSGAKCGCGVVTASDYSCANGWYYLVFTGTKGQYCYSVQLGYVQMRGTSNDVTVGLFESIVIYLYWYFGANVAPTVYDSIGTVPPAEGTVIATYEAQGAQNCYCYVAYSSTGNNYLVSGTNYSVSSCASQYPENYSTATDSMYTTLTAPSS